MSLASESLELFASRDVRETMRPIFYGIVGGLAIAGGVVRTLYGTVKGWEAHRANKRDSEEKFRIALEREAIHEPRPRARTFAEAQQLARDNGVIMHILNATSEYEQAEHDSIAYRGMSLEAANQLIPPETI